MSLDNIQLPAIVLQDLYSKSLYNLKTDTSVIPAIQDRSIAYLGNCGKKIVLIVDDPANIFLPDDELDFLLGILTACKLTMADIALINISKNPGLHYSSISEQLKAEKIFLFGMGAEALALPLQFPNYQVQQFNNQVYLSSVSLTALQKKQEEKKKLWSCLKKIFSL